MSSSLLLLIPVLVLIGLFLVRSARTELVTAAALRHSTPTARPQALTFAGHRYPMEQKDRLPVLLITLIYTATAFFSLGTTDAPQTPYDFADGQPVTIEISGDPAAVYGLRSYSGLGTGAYNVEVSADGQHWSTLWQRKDDPNDANRITGWYWADAQGYAPSYALEQKYNQLYKWLDITMENPQTIRYLRITGKADKGLLELSKLCLLDADGQPIPFNWTMADGSASDPALTAVLHADSAAAETPSWYNSTYFDEIYHARTAQEHIQGVYPYEITHPPLGKLIQGLGIRLFGMCPFGWRFMGTLFGVLMLPILYIFLKNMFGKTAVAACGTVLFAADFMHLTQTRIATIDTYGVFFILCMYFFMYRYLTLPKGASFAKGMVPLGLSGLMWGLGAASKWTVIYAAVGLAILYFMGFYQRLRDWGKAPGRTGWIVKTLLFSVLMFVIVPFFIYTLSYWPYAAANGSTAGPGRVLLDIAAFPFIQLPQLLQELVRPLAEGEQHVSPFSGHAPNIVDVMLNNQFYMLNYHQGVNQLHPYSSRWYEWMVNARPILYYMDNTIPGHTVRFAAFSNPVVCWTGLFAMLSCAARAFRLFRSRVAFTVCSGIIAAALVLIADPNLDPANLESGQLAPHLVLVAVLVLVYLLAGVGTAFLFTRPAPWASCVLVGFLSQLVPWMFIGRTTFEYHYFPSILFLVLAIAGLFNTLAEDCPKWKLPVYGLTGLTVGCYALFYPVLIGLSIPVWYEHLLTWLPGWPF